MKRVACMLAVLVCVARTTPASADTIKQIVIGDNTKTTDDTIRYIAGIEEGDDFTPDDIDTIKKRLVSSGLFKEVDVYYEPVLGGVRVTILAKDKHSWAAAPTFYNQPTNFGGGFGFGENNLFGKDQKLLLYAQLATGDSFFIGAYVVPSIDDTRFSFQTSLYLERSRVIEYAAPKAFIDDPQPVRQSKLNYLNGGLKLGMKIVRSLSIYGRIRGAWVSYDQTHLAKGATVSDVTTDPMVTPNTIPDPGKKGWDVSNEWDLEFNRMANWYGIKSGTKLTLSYEYALPQLGSDFNYWYATLHYEKAIRLFSATNFVLKGEFGYGKDLPFQQEYTSGGTHLRGYKNAEFRGDLKAAMNAEYSVPLFTIKGVSFRGLAFYDTAYTAFPDIQSGETFRNYLPGEGGTLGAREWKNDVGLGTRLYIRQIVLPLLGLDVGYGLESGGVEVYFAIGLSD